MQLQVFKYQSENHFEELTAVEINGEIWFVATDVCKLLELSNPTESIKSLEDEERLVSEILRSGQKRRVNLVNESGLYSLIFRSNKPSAKRFRRWVTKEVLPSIRKTGSYTVGIDRLERPDFIIRYMENYDHVSKGHFSVINQLYINLYARLEHAGYQIPNKAIDGKRMRPDVSVGRGFSDYLKAKHPSLCEHYKYYNHTFSDIGLDFDARQYPNSMMHIFIEYIEDEWIPKYASDYFKKRDLKALDYLPKLLKAS